jgi:3-methyladenine DNA glycosylase AlkD
MQEIIEFLYENSEDKYAIFQRKLIPNIASERIIGVRTPILRGYARQLIKEQRDEHFLEELPHSLFEENQLHAFIISDIKDYGKCITELEHFMPYIDNWATCDQTSPKVFKRHKEQLLPYIYKWLESEHTYMVRFAIGMLMQHYLDDEFNVEYINRVTCIRSEEYYINMEIAWYMATALAKQWDSAVGYIENRLMTKWVHNKTIQKAVESRRISEEKKAYLRSLKQ